MENEFPAWTAKKRKEHKAGYSPDVEFCWAGLERFFFEKTLVNCFGETST